LGPGIYFVDLAPAIFGSASMGGDGLSGGDAIDASIGTGLRANV
jgi:hypothetical protein